MKTRVSSDPVVLTAGFIDVNSAYLLVLYCLNLVKAGIVQLGLKILAGVVAIEYYTIRNGLTFTMLK